MLAIAKRIRCLVALLALVGAAFSQGQTAEWKPIFDGKTLEGWRETPFHRRGSVRVENGAILLEPGTPLTGVNYTGEFPRLDYEVRFEAMRMQGNDFFASLTFPVADAYCTFITGGWGGDIVGFSSIDGWDASENETRTYFTFDNNRWYRFRIQVTAERLRAWIDDELTVDVGIAGRAISLRYGPIELSAPVGFASYATRGAIRNIAYRPVQRAGQAQ